MTKTRAEQIRDMNNKELSEWFYDNFVFDCADCMAKDICDKLPNDDDETDCVDLVKAWLEEEPLPTLKVGDIIEMCTDVYGVRASWVVASDAKLYTTDGRYSCMELKDLDYDKIYAIYSIEPNKSPKIIWERI